MAYPFNKSDAKNILQTHFVREQLGEPIYVTKSFQLSPCGSYYQSTIRVGDDVFYSSENYTRKVDAEKDAAYEACKFLYDTSKLQMSLSGQKKLQVYKELERDQVLSVTTAKNVLEHYSVTRQVPRPIYESVFETKTGMWRSTVQMKCASTGEICSKVSEHPNPCKTTSEKIAALGLCSILARKDPDYTIPRVFLQQQQQ